ncbi:MAG: TIGR00266 family protein [Methanobrevibacter sp.]|uniref:TIGR00266 family protein n=1 Tax=Methanobrevibacter sp. TaxID=66852 RepID=UPI0025D76233|nr:TIGR00266 family protein [Methanobrevibacter sp.]MBR3112764.1 TIGR00266 family protein [Methanobrevibacter sp.]MBR6992639.1 TIGR00266 family protein [Methanobrevibacter sp.]
MEYEIKGGAFPIVICTLQKGETMKNETGAMAFMTSDMKMETSTGGGLLKGLGRALAGDTLFLNFFTAQSDNEQIGFSACTPGKIMSIRLDGLNTIIGQKNAFLAAEDSVDVDIFFKKKLGAGLFGGEGFVLQKFSGNGMLFIEIDGEVIEKELQPGEKLLLDPGHIAAMDESIDFDIERVKGAKNILFGEGLFFAKLTGPGKVWIQTMPISKLAAALIPFLPTSSGSDWDF